MADENEIITPTPEPSGAQKRITDLSEKVEVTSKERDEKAKLVEERDKEIASLKKETEFSNGFADVLGTHPQAKEHKDEIKVKVLAGYTVPDATFAVLGAAGKLGGTSQVKPQVAGGSAATTPQSGAKELKDMSLAEKREALAKEIVWQ